jgi:hypothetical protein
MTDPDFSSVDVTNDGEGGCCTCVGGCLRCCNRAAKVPCYLTRCFFCLIFLALIVVAGVAFYYSWDAIKTYNMLRELVVPLMEEREESDVGNPASFYS